MFQIDIPEEFESKLMDLGLGAYSGLDRKKRSKLKSCVDILHRFWGETFFERRMAALRQKNGICLGERVCPRPWGLFVFDADYGSAPGLISALMPAILAKVPNLVLCMVDRQGKASLQGGLSAAVELLGIEDVYALNYYAVVKLIQGLIGKTGPDSGSVVLLGATSVFSDLAGHCLQHRLPTMNLPTSMKIGIEPDSGADLDFLAWAHPQAELEIMQPGSRPEDCFALVGNAASEAFLSWRSDCSGHSRLVLAPGQEHLWIWPKLDLDFFSIRELCVFSHE